MKRAVTTAGVCQRQQTSKALISRDALHLSLTAVLLSTQTGPGGGKQTSDSVAQEY